MEEQQTPPAVTPSTPTPQPVVPPAAPDVPEHHAKHSAPPHAAQPKSHRPLPVKLWWAVSLAVAILIAVAAGWIYLSTHQTVANESANVNSKEFQALFLTNGQVYFGKLTDLNGKYVKLTDVYYLQIQQGQAQNLQDGKKAATSQSQVSLTKLGSELHGPEDQMYVASDQVLFWENLKPSGKVTQAIDNYQQKQ